MADPILDEELFRIAREEAVQMLNADPELKKHPKVREEFLKMITTDTP